MIDLALIEIDLKLSYKFLEAFSKASLDLKGYWSIKGCVKKLGWLYLDKMGKRNKTLPKVVVLKTGVDALSRAMKDFQKWCHILSFLSTLTLPKWHHFVWFWSMITKSTSFWLRFYHFSSYMHGTQILPTFSHHIRF